MKNNNALSIATEQKDWRQLDRDGLLQMARINPKFFRKGQFADQGKVEALGLVLTALEINEYAPGDNSDHRRWNAAIGLLSQSPIWEQSRQAAPIVVDLGEIASSQPKLVEWAIAHCYAKRVRGAAA